MPHDDFSADLERYLGDMPHGNVGFLARGEYSLNYLVRGEPDLVARLVTGTQMGLALEEQAPYEYHALELLAASGVTPKPHHVDPNPDGLPYPLILEEYLPGRPSTTRQTSPPQPVASPPSMPSASPRSIACRSARTRPPPS